MDTRMRQLTVMGILGGMICIGGSMMYVEVITAFPALIGKTLPVFGFGGISAASIIGAFIWAAR